MFIFWNVAMFHMLWTLSRRAKDQMGETDGGYPAWVGRSLTVYLQALTSVKDRPMRRRILLLSVLLTLSIAVFTYFKTRAL